MENSFKQYKQGFILSLDITFLYDNVHTIGTHIIVK